MIEFKIRFKNGDMAYFKVKDINTIEEAEEIKDWISNAMQNNLIGGFTMIDLIDDKITAINIREIVTFGYSLVDSDYIVRE